MHTSLRKWLIAAAVLTATVFGGKASAGPIILDDFNVGSYSRISGQGINNTSPTVNLTPNVTRAISHSGTPGPNFQNGEGVFLNTGSSLGRLELATAASTARVVAEYSFLGGNNLIVDSQGFRLDFDFYDLGGGASLEITAEATFANSSTFSSTVSLNPSAFTPTSVNIANAGFLGQPITGLKFFFNNDPRDQAVDFRLDRILVQDGRIPGFEIVPEPASMAVFGLLTLAGGAFARRKMKAVAA